jgi:Fic family protein
MGRNEADEKAAKMSAIEDRGEHPGLMEPLVLSQSAPRRTELTDLAVELAGAANGLRRSLPGGIVVALADLVRAMNCYYSNLIENHDTHPVDIERALEDDFSDDQEQRNLQLEAKAHIEVQQWIDKGGIQERETTAATIREIHRRFCNQLPDELLWVEHPNTGERLKVLPGEFRVHDVEVGRHVAISPPAIARFLERFDEAYSGLGKAETILASAAAHHRLLWIHPFLDGNGRVARLMSHAILLRTLDTGGVWSIARGLARQAGTYKEHLRACDAPRRNDLDGRGNLSEEALADFTRFFLETCLDQVRFMEDLVQPEKLRARIRLWADEEIATDNLPRQSGIILDALLYRGELPRSELPDLVNASARTARRVVAALANHGVVTAETSRSPLRITFPAKLASRWLPGLFPEQPG